MVVKAGEQVDGGRRVELMKMRVVPDPMMEQRGSVPVPLFFLGPLMFALSVPVMVDSGEDLDTGTVYFRRSGHSVVLEDPPPLTGVHALWIRPIGDGRYRSELVPFGGGRLDLAGVAPPAPATAAPPSRWLT